MLKSDRFYNSTSSLLAGLVLIIISLCMLLGKDKLYFDFMNLFLLTILIIGTFQFIEYFFHKHKGTDGKITFTKCFFNLFFCLVLSCFPKIPMSILPILFALYLILNGIIKLMTYIILRYENTNGRLLELFQALIYLVIGVPLLISPLKKLSVMLTVMGVYILLLGINFIFDFINTIIPRKVKRKLQRRIKITLPVLFQAIIPYQVLNEINYFINKEEYNKKIVYEEKNQDIKPDLEVFVHSSMNGFNRLGHVDICFKDQVYSYGNYDDSSKRLFDMIGDGVLFVTDKEHYIPFCIKHSHKTIFGFGLKLNDRQIKNIDNYIDRIFTNIYEWNSPIQEDMISKKKINKDDYTDYASCLYKSTKAKFYKFETGKFKKYFVLGINCCLLADSIIGKSGSDILKMNGIITPGTYYEYLNREFKKKNSMVISKNIYNLQSTKLLKRKK